MKKTSKILIYIIVFGLFSSCSHYVVNSAGYIRPPINKKFPYEKRFTELKDLSVIDTTAVYYLTDSYYYKNSKEYKNRDAYIRFYGDGRFKLQGLKNYPTVEEVNDPNKGIVGYYFLKDKVVKMQVYSDIGGGSLQLEFGYIDENKNLILMHNNPRYDFAIGYNEKKIRRLIEKSPFSPKIYKKIYLENMEYIKPNW
jgi:hypothetical protein